MDKGFGRLQWYELINYSTRTKGSYIPITPQRKSLLGVSIGLEPACSLKSVLYNQYYTYTKILQEVVLLVIVYGLDQFEF